MRYAIRTLLKEVASFVDFRGEESQLDTTFSDLSTDSRSIEPGSLFIALRGERFDGHDFVGEAFQKGAVAAVVSKEWADEHAQFFERPLLVARDTLEALCRIARFHRRRFDIPVVALTGTVGKTTAKELIAAVLAQRFLVLKNPSSFNNAIGVSLTLARLRPEHQVAVCELGTNHRGEIASLTEIVEPSVGVILNVGRGHLEFLGNVEGVREEKYDLARWIAEHQRGPVFLNVDDPVLRSTPPEFVRTVWFGQGSAAEVRVVLEREEDGRPVISFDGVSARLQLLGRHHVSNAAAAVAVGLHFGLSPEEIARGLSAVTPAPHRGQVIRIGGVVLIDDAYNCNPESARAACRTLAAIDSASRRILVFGDMLELGEVAEHEHRELGRELKSLGVQMLFAHGPLAKATAEAAASTGMEAQHFETKETLIEALASEIRKGDVVLFKGSRGMRMEEVFERLRDRIESAVDG